MQLTRFRVTNYRNILDSGWIEVSKITAIVGQNEAGKSNLFEALYRINPFVQEDTYNIDEDWPVDEWGGRDPTTIVCEAHFSLSFDEISQLYQASTIEQPASEDEPIEPNVTTSVEVPRELTVVGSRTYNRPVAKVHTCDSRDAQLTE